MNTANEERKKPLEDAHACTLANIPILYEYYVYFIHFPLASHQKRMYE